MTTRWSWMTARLALVTLVLVAVRVSRARQSAGSLRQVPRAGLSGAADLAAGSRAPERPRAEGVAAKPAASSDQPSPTTDPTLSVLAHAWPHCPPRTYDIHAHSRNTGHNCPRGAAGASLRTDNLNVRAQHALARLGLVHEGTLRSSFTHLE
jgi:hypothetical protein